MAAEQLEHRCEPGSTTSVRDGRGGWVKLLTFRALAVLLGLTPLLVAELALRLAGFDAELPPASFASHFAPDRPLFVPDQTGDTYQISTDRLDFFRPEQFSKVKPKNERRIFCVGGSTVQGRPFSTETSFTTWLALSLNACDETNHWEVINCGGISYGTVRLRPIVTEVLRYQPDAIILMTGHNELLEQYHTTNSATENPLLARTLAVAEHSRVFQSIRMRYVNSRQRPSGSPFVSSTEEPETLLDFKGGLEKFHYDEKYREFVMRQFHANVTLMVQEIREARVPLLLVAPISNLRDTYPFKSEHRHDLTDDELKVWSHNVQSAQRYLTEDQPWNAVRELNQAIDLDPQYAATYYTLGKAYERLGEFDLAREAYLQAKEYDACPLRMLETMRESLARIAEDSATPYLDAHEFFRARSQMGIVGDAELVDHVHPSIAGHQQLALELQRVMVEQELISIENCDIAARERRWERRMASLKPLYFHKGMQHLKALQGWAAGRAEQER